MLLLSLFVDTADFADLVAQYPLHNKANYISVPTSQVCLVCAKTARFVCTEVRGSSNKHSCCTSYLYFVSALFPFPSASSSVLLICKWPS